MSLYLIKSFKSAFNDAASKAGLQNDIRDSLNKKIVKFVDFKTLFSKQIISTVYVSYDLRFSLINKVMTNYQKPFLKNSPLKLSRSIERLILIA